MDASLKNFVEKNLITNENQPNNEKRISYAIQLNRYDSM
jgi:hypothetical protein